MQTTPPTSPFSMSSGLPFDKIAPSGVVCMGIDGSPSRKQPKAKRSASKLLSRTILRCLPLLAAVAMGFRALHVSGAGACLQPCPHLLIPTRASVNPQASLICCHRPISAAPTPMSLALDARLRGDGRWYGHNAQRMPPAAPTEQAAVGCMPRRCTDLRIS